MACFNYIFTNNLNSWRMLLIILHDPLMVRYNIFSNFFNHLTEI